jgi:hypothetical protein
MFTKEEVDDQTLIERIRRILIPFEYASGQHCRLGIRDTAGIGSEGTNLCRT